MNLIKQNGPFCLVTSAAMCLGVHPEEIHEYLGHDGTEIWWPPAKMRGIHMQEIIDYAMTLGKCFFPVEVTPMIAHDEETPPRQICAINGTFEETIRGRVGIIITAGHACAWDGAVVHDPKGFIRKLPDYTIIEAWLLADLIK